LFYRLLDPLIIFFHRSLSWDLISSYMTYHALKLNFIRPSRCSTWSYIVYHEPKPDSSWMIGMILYGLSCVENNSHPNHFAIIYHLSFSIISLLFNIFLYLTSHSSKLNIKWGNYKHPKIAFYIIDRVILIFMAFIIWYNIMCR